MLLIWLEIAINPICTVDLLTTHTLKTKHATVQLSLQYMYFRGFHLLIQSLYESAIHSLSNLSTFLITLAFIIAYFNWFN